MKRVIINDYKVKDADTERELEKITFTVKCPVCKDQRGLMRLFPDITGLLDLDCPYCGAHLAVMVNDEGEFLHRKEELKKKKNASA